MLGLFRNVSSSADNIGNIRFNVYGSITNDIQFYKALWYGFNIALKESHLKNEYTPMMEYCGLKYFSKYVNDIIFTEHETPILLNNINANTQSIKRDIITGMNDEFTKRCFIEYLAQTNNDNYGIFVSLSTAKDIMYSDIFSKCFQKNSLFFINISSHTRQV